MCNTHCVETELVRCSRNPITDSVRNVPLPSSSWSFRFYIIMWHLNSVKGHKYISWQWNMISHPCDASSPTKSIPRTSKLETLLKRLQWTSIFGVGPVVLKMWKDTMIGFGSSCTHMLLHTPKGGIIIWCTKRWTSISSNWFYQQLYINIRNFWNSGLRVTI